MIGGGWPKVRQLLDRLLALGVKPERSSRENRQIRSANLMGLFFFGATVPYIPWMAVTGSFIACTAFSLACAAYMATLALNHRGLLLAARCTPLLAGTFLVVVLTALMGTATGVHLALLIVSCWPFQLFNVDSEPLPLVSLVTLSLGAYLLIDLSSWFPERTGLSNETIEQLRVGFEIPLIGLFGATLWYFYRGNQRNESKLSESLVKLEAARLHAEQQSQSKTEFLAVMSHELRTPLNGVVGAADLLRGSPLDNGQQELLETIDVSAQRLGHQLKRVWQLVNEDIGAPPLAHKENDQTFVLAELVQKVVATHCDDARLKGLTMRVNSEQTGKLLVTEKADPLRQVVSELLSNAIRFTSQGHVSVQASLGDSVEGHAQLEISISDTGPGIAPEHRQRLFQPFSCAGSSRNHGLEGLGLALSRRLVRALGGDLTLETSPEGGTLARLEARVAVSAQRATAPSNHATASVQAESLRTPVALLVDDNKINRMVLGRIIKGLGFQVVMAEDGQAAVQLESERCFNVIFMDIQMPVMDGLEAIAVIRERERSLSGDQPRTPIVVVTANASEQLRQEAQELGIEGYLTKPCKKADFEEALRGLGLQGHLPVRAERRLQSAKCQF